MIYFVSDAPTASSSSIFLIDTLMDHADAESRCQESGGHLLSIHSKDTQQIAMDLCPVSPNCWIGLYQNGSDHWKWTDHSATDYGFDGGYPTSTYPWTHGQPDNWEGNEDCLAVTWWDQSSDFVWNDEKCTNWQYALCQVMAEPTSDPSGDPSKAPSTDPIKGPSMDPTKAPSIDPTKAPSTDPTQNPSIDPTPTPSIEPTNAPSASPTKLPTSDPTIDPTSDPTIQPTKDPTKSPTRGPAAETTNDQFEGFGYSVDASFSISGWSHGQLSEVNDNIGLFASELTKIIHFGFDADPDLNTNDIALNISTINEHLVDDLIDSDSDSGPVLLESLSDGMRLEYLIGCSSIDCHYIVHELNRTRFENVVSAGLNEYFINTNVSGPMLSFVVDSLSESESVASITKDTDTGDGSTIVFIAIFVLLCLCIFVCGSSAGIFLFYKKHRRASGDTASPRSVETVVPGRHPDPVPPIHAPLSIQHNLSVPLEHDALPPMPRAGTATATATPTQREGRQRGGILETNRCQSAEIDMHPISAQSIQPQFSVTSSIAMEDESQLKLEDSIQAHVCCSSGIADV